MTIPLEPYRIVTDYDGLHEAFRDRVEDLDVPRLELDVAANLPAGYASKLLAVHPKKRFGPNSLGGLLRATGMALVVVLDDERFEPVRASMATRKRPMRNAALSMPENQQKAPISSEQLIKEHMRKIGAMGASKAGKASAKRRMKTMSKRARQRSATHAARMRWSKRK